MTDKEVIKALECCVDWCGNISCWDCPLKNTGCIHFDKLKETLDLINRQKAEIERLREDIAILDSKNSVKDKLLTKAEAKMKAMQMDNEQLKTDICNARMNLEHIRELYEERANLCEEQDRQLLELDFILANYPYMVHFGNGTMCTENHREYERLLASISANAVNEVLEELKTTLVINNEGNTEIFDYEYTLETIEELKIKR